MPVAVTIPRLGWTMQEGVFVGWIKHDGDPVRPGDALYQLESDKSVQEVECLETGVLHVPVDGPKDGERVAVGAVIAYVLQPGETPIEPATEAPAKPQAAEATGRRLPISPRARRRAAELGVDWSALTGSGRTGRIRERDVQSAAVGPATTPTGDLTAHSPLRKTIAQRLRHSLATTAPVTLTATVDATNLVNLRRQFAAAGDKEAPGVTAFLVKLTAVALRRHPRLNARWEESGIVSPAGVHIGVAVDTEAGLLVPVLRDVPDLPLRQVARRLHELADGARNRTLNAADIQGGTFTVTNLGAYGVEMFTPIINHPECAILGVGRLRREPVVGAEDQITVRDRLSLSLTFDHRIVDGAPAARFLQELGRIIENPGPWLMA